MGKKKDSKKLERYVVHINCKRTHTKRLSVIHGTNRTLRHHYTKQPVSTHIVHRLTQQRTHSAIDTKQVSKVIRQKAASPTCHRTLLRIDSSDLHSPSNTWSLGPTNVSRPNGNSISSVLVAQHIRVIDTQTDRPRYVQHLWQ